MAIDINDEILQDFLVEAGELLESLNEQLIDLEQNPEDRDLLNAVFRSFHTIKGGAGFLNLNPLVTVCHHAEDVFNLLRNNERKITPHLMDIILRVLDVLNVMFGDLKSGQEPEPAPEPLVEALAKLAVPAGAAEEEVAEPAPAPPAEPPPPPAEPPPSPVAPQSNTDSATVAAGDDEITPEEFEALLDALPEHGQACDPQDAHPSTGAETVETAETAAGSDELITEDEFDSLLEQLHGSAVAAPDQPTEAITAPDAQAALKVQAAPAAASAAASPDAQSAAKPNSASAASATVASAAQAEQEDPAVAASVRAARSVSVGETSVRVDTNRLDEIMNLVGELVLVRNRMSMLRERAADDELGKAISSLALVTADLQTAVMKTRMQPIKKVFSRFPRVVRDLSRSMGKEIDFETYGEETDLDKNLVEALADPLVHLIRNAVDHGVEMPDERAAKGKPRKGKIVLGAAQEGDHISLVIEDDGKGMDPNVLRGKAVEKGLIEPAKAERMSDRDAFNLIFMAGLSTKEQISDVSGRGVGMDVVKTRISQLNGTVDIDSRLGKGTRLSVKLPLTLAILPSLMVILNQRRFAIPLSSVSEILDLDLTKTHFVDDQEAIMVRRQALPLYYTQRWLHPHRPVEPKEVSHVVVVHVGQRKVGLVVDGLVGQEEVVIKPLGRGLQGVPALAGATITGDGGIALIIDVPELLDQMGKFGAGSRSTRGSEKILEMEV